MAKPLEFPIPVTVKMTQELVDLIDEYRRAQKDLPTRPEAVRRIVEQALTKSLPRKAR